MANPLWVDQWSPSDLETLLRKRDEERKTWQVIALEMGRKLTSCHRRWKQLQPVADVVEVDTPPIAPRSLHERLGIETTVARVAVLAGPYRNVPSWDAQTRVSSDHHLYRASVTLPKVLA